MPDSTLTSEQLAAQASAPATTSTDGVTITERPAADIIALDRYAAEKAAAAATARPVTGWASLRPAVAVFPGAQ